MITRRTTFQVGSLEYSVPLGSFGISLAEGWKNRQPRTCTRIEQQVAADAVKQYEIAKRSGSAMDAYVHAGLVVAAYLQAKDEVKYTKWKAIEKQEASRAGMPGE